jgi:drug/metabolite transporter (DMT)-like permease
MLLLFLVSLLWAFSFGLIKRLTGLDSAFIAAARLGLALLVFLPFLRLRGLATRTALALLGIGAIQFGLMYLAYNESFHYLATSYEVAVLTLTTPILVTLFADAFERRWNVRALLAALLAVAGGGCIVVKTSFTGAPIVGIALVQISNAAFALGQVLYRRVRSAGAAASFRDRDVFGLLYAGALAVTLPATLLRTNFRALPLNATKVEILIYLGIVASGLGFFLWNLGAKRANAGTLAVMNNVKIPLTVAVSLLVFRETADLPRLLAGGALMVMAVWLAEKKSRSTPL